MQLKLEVVFPYFGGYSFHQFLISFLTAEIWINASFSSWIWCTSMLCCYYCSHVTFFFSFVFIVRQPFSFIKIYNNISLATTEYVIYLLLLKCSICAWMYLLTVFFVTFAIPNPIRVTDRSKQDWFPLFSMSCIVKTSKDCKNLHMWKTRHETTQTIEL